MFQWLQAPVVYVRISKNRFHLRHIQNQKETTLNAIEAFTSSRLLVGEFTVAEHLLKSGLKQLFEGRFFISAPVIVIHPTEMVEKGISQVEDRLLKELAAGAGARKAIVWTGHELTDYEVLTRAGQGE